MILKHLTRLLVACTLFLIPAVMGGNYGFAQSKSGKTVTVSVSDDMGPVIGAGVMIKGSTNGVVTDLDGKAVINGLSDDAVLEVTCLGSLLSRLN